MESRSLRYADLAAMPDDNVRREIIDGELFVSPSPRTRHQTVSGRLYLALANYLQAHGGGLVFYSPLDVVLSDANVVEPDIILVTDDQAEIISEANIKGVPALLIEIVSESRMDRVGKRDLYEKFGVSEYWIVDPDADRIEVYRAGERGYGKPEIFEGGDVLELSILPGFRLDVAALFTR